MFDPNPNEISNQTLIPNDAWNDGSCASDHERLESGAVQNWLGARVRAVLSLPWRGDCLRRARVGGRECAAEPPRRDPEAIQFVRYDLCRLVSHYCTDWCTWLFPTFGRRVRPPTQPWAERSSARPTRRTPTPPPLAVYLP